MSPLPAIGVDVEIKSGIGPVISNPIRSKADVEKLGEINPEEDVPYVLDTIKLLTQEQLTVQFLDSGSLGIYVLYLLYIYITCPNTPNTYCRVYIATYIYIYIYIYKYYI